MKQLRGKIIAVLAEGDVAAALARRLVADGACVALGAPQREATADMVAELKWECAAIAWRPLDPHAAKAADEIDGCARAAFGGPHAMVRKMSGAIEIATMSQSGAERRITTISAEAAGVAIDPELVARAVAFALAGPVEYGVSAIVLRPLPRAA